MDPNETLTQLRKIFAAVDPEQIDSRSYYIVGVEFERARDLFQALDEWIVNGGFLPDGWKRNG
jgi:hypothetical protein